MPVNIIQGDGVMNVALSGEIDHHTAAAIRQEVDERAEKTKPAVLTLDFADVSFMDSSGIGLIMGRYKLIRALGGQLQVTGASGSMAKIMRLAGLEKLGVLGGDNE